MRLHAHGLRCSVHGGQGYMLDAWLVGRMRRAWHLARRSQYADMVHDAGIYALGLMLLVSMLLVSMLLVSMLLVSMLLVSMLLGCRPSACRPVGYALGLMPLGCYVGCIWNAAPLSKGEGEVKGWYGTIARTDGARKLGSGDLVHGAWYLNRVLGSVYHLMVPRL